RAFALEHRVEGFLPFAGFGRVAIGDEGADRGHEQLRRPLADASCESIEQLPCTPVVHPGLMRMEPFHTSTKVPGTGYQVLVGAAAPGFVEWLCGYLGALAPAITAVTAVSRLPGSTSSSS